MLQHAVRLLQMSSLDFTEQIERAASINPFLVLDDEANVVDQKGWSASSEARMYMQSDALESIPSSTSLREHLQSQLNTKRIDSRTHLLASVIASSLDDDGYLRDDLASLGDLQGVTPGASSDELERALKQVHSLEPSGVGARSVSECLLLQMQSIDACRIRSLAQEIASRHLDLLAIGDIRKLAERIGALQTEVQLACDAIRRLDPRPGLKFGIHLTPYVVPDVIARRQARGSGWTVEINDAVVPKLKLDAVCANLFYKSRSREQTTQDSRDTQSAKDAGRTALDELQSHLTEARWTVRNVAQRFATIRDVANVIVERQRLFMEHGPLGMKPLALRDVAEEIGIHESTVSRVTNNKFISTPHGTFELKHFFSRGMAMSDGNECSPHAVKELVQKCITEENAEAPLSDAAIAKLIQSQGVSVARRTVTKYRQSMRIAPVGKRSMADLPSRMPPGTSLRTA